MSAVSTYPVITPVDRLALTLCLAIITHGIIILGVTFTSEEFMTPRFDTMEIILVQQKETTPPEDAKLLAQANLQGGGEVTKQLIPSTQFPAPFPDNQPETEIMPPAEMSPPESVHTEEIAKLTAESDTVVSKPQQNTPNQNQPKQTKPGDQRTKPNKHPTATALLQNSFKIAALSAQIKRKLEAKAQRPRRRFISASTRAYKYAAYMEAWRAKVERVGNLNYPDEARKRKLSGNLILDVALNPDGSVHQITIRRSSGYKILDDAAIRIVNLASPFAPFPENIRKETDILHITRTWQFLNNSSFR